MAIKYLDAKRIQGTELSRHSTPVVIGGTSSGTGSSTWADGTQDVLDHTVWYDIRRGVTVGEDGHQSGNGVTGVANNTTNGGDGFTDHPGTSTPSRRCAAAQWGMRFKVTIDSITTNSSSDVAIGIGMASTNSVGNGNMGGHQAGFLMKFNNSTRKFYVTGKKGASWDLTDTQYIEEIGTNMMATGTWYVTLWMPIAMSKHSFYCKVTNNSDYVTSATQSGEVNDNDNWGNEDSDYGFVKFFRVGNSKPSGASSIDNHVYFKVEDMKLWNGTNDFTTTPTTTIDMAHSTGVGSSSTGAKSRYTKYNERSPLIIREEANWENNGTKMNHTPVAVVEKAALVNNLPEGTIFEETDTKKVYFLQSNAWEQAYPRTPTFEDDFSTDNYVNSGTDIQVINNHLEFEILRHTTSDTLYRDIYTVLGNANISNTDWILRFKVNITDDASGGHSSHKKWFFGFSNNGNTAWSGNSNRLGWGMQCSSGSSERYIQMSWADNENGSSNTVNMDTSVVTSGGNETLYYQLQRIDTTTLRGTLFSDSTYETVVETKDQTITAGDGEDMRYFTCFNDNSADSAGDISGTIDDMEFWNGVTEP